VVGKIAYIFPGQGAQFVGMGKDLYDSFPEAKAVFDKADNVLGFELSKLCFEGPKEKLSSTKFSQPAILTVSIACLKVIQSIGTDLGVTHALGLSLGEYSALIASSALEFADALKLVYARGQFMEEASRKNPGKMASIIGLDLALAEEVCSQSGAGVANLNCPGQVVISGKDEAIEKARSLANEKGAKRSIVLDVSGPFHSSLMNEASAKLKNRLDEIKFSKPSIPVISNVDAEYEDSEEKIKKNLVNQVNHKTLWEDSIRKVSGEGTKTFLEIGPGKVLKGLLRRIDSELVVYNIGTVKDIEEFKNVIKG